MMRFIHTLQDRSIDRTPKKNSTIKRSKDFAINNIAQKGDFSRWALRDMMNDAQENYIELCIAKAEGRQRRPVL